MKIKDLLGLKERSESISKIMRNDGWREVHKNQGYNELLNREVEIDKDEVESLLWRRFPELQEMTKLIAKFIIKALPQILKVKGGKR